MIDHLKNNHIAALNLGVVDFPADETKARKLFDLAKKLNLYGLTTESTNAIDILEKLSQEYDLKVCFHNHPKPTARNKAENKKLKEVNNCVCKICLIKRTALCPPKTNC